MRERIDISFSSYLCVSERKAVFLCSEYVRPVACALPSRLGKGKLKSLFVCWLGEKEETVQGTRSGGRTDGREVQRTLPRSNPTVSPTLHPPPLNTGSCLPPFASHSSMTATATRAKRVGPRTMQPIRANTSPPAPHPSTQPPFLTLSHSFFLSHSFMRLQLVVY